MSDEFFKALDAAERQADMFGHAARAFVERADAIYLLDGWEDSAGARGELNAYLNSEFGGGCVMVERGTVKRASEKGAD